MTKIPVSELHEAAYPGDGGIHRLMGGSVAIPLGLKPVYKSPMLAERRYWDQAARAGGRDAAAGRHPSLATCSNCTIRIGRGYIERELYLVATTLDKHVKAGQSLYTPHWRFICGSCASLYLPKHAKGPLSFGYALVCEADWGHPACHTLNRLNMRLVRQKIADLEQQLMPAWTEHFRRVHTALERYGSITRIDASQLREPAFERFIYAANPTPLTYSELSLPRAA